MIALLLFVTSCIASLRYMPGRKIFITTVSIGTCDQFTDMHRLFDVSGEINASKSKGLKGQSGVDKIEGTFYCRSATAEVRECLSAWNEIEHYDYNLVETRQGLGAPGGWRTVAKHIMSLSEDDDLVSLFFFEGTHFFVVIDLTFIAHFQRNILLILCACHTKNVAWITVHATYNSWMKSTFYLGL